MLNALLLSTSVHASIDCTKFEEELKPLEKIKKNTVMERGEEVARLESAHKQMAEKISSLYFNSVNSDQIKIKELIYCINQNKHKFSNFESMLQSVIWNYSITYLESFSPKSKKLITIYKNSPKLRFSLGHEYNNYEDEKAYYVRGEESVFMDITKIPPNEWPIIMSHELVHAVDVSFLKNVNQYGNAELLKKMETLAMNYYAKGITQLSHEEELNLYLWVNASIGRGLLAEVRAWAVTFAIYEQALINKKVTPISWMEDILKEKSPNETYADFSFRYFDPKFVSSYHDWFEIPFFKGALDEMRESYRSGKTLIPIDALLLNILQ